MGGAVRVQSKDQRKLIAFCENCESLALRNFRAYGIDSASGQKQLSS